MRKKGQKKGAVLLNRILAFALVILTCEFSLCSKGYSHDQEYAQDSVRETIDPEIIQIDTFEALSKYIENLNLSKRDLVIFDVDMVLTVPRNPIFQIENLKKFRSQFKAFRSQIPSKYKDLMLLFFVLDSPQQLSDDRMPDLVDFVYEKAHQLFLSSLLTGRFSNMISAAEWRAFSLASAKYKIYDTDIDRAIYKHFPEHFGSYPMRSGNLILTNGEGAGVTKGKLVLTYIKEKRLSLSRVILIDDRRYNLVDVHDRLQSIFPHIQFVGIDYKGAYKEYPVPPGYKAPTEKRVAKKLKEVHDHMKDALKDTKF